ncbi:protein prenylyltransferase [Durotheca rogersii]|uniref:protein prenylyltransferase n=1 Tax=Durotheca rogersii TaxID=419775 RepID=UPI00221E5759|nr:protein prenylyltransferase [Durotheca rogersii]KAI5855540.1 protein prenylyltransferase [Durotheca rogersii]
MASHGVSRTSRSARTEEHRQRDSDRIKQYRELENSVRAQAASNRYDDALFQLTSKLLRLNPEYYTIWNVRRRCLISGSFSGRSRGSSPSKASPSISPSATTRPSSDDSSPSSSDATRQGQLSPTAGKNGTTVDGEAERRGERGSGEVEGEEEGGADADADADVSALQSELAFTVPLLLEFPKCYWIWKYRRWLLEQAIVRLPLAAARKIWDAELALASKMLTRDRRNFHAWDYRRYVVATLESASLGGKSMAEDEFAYTELMIRHDLSNFSAWHNRSRLMPRLLDERNADAAAREAFLKKELSFIHEALNVGPEDQSLWYYHQYLLSQITDHAGTTIVPALTAEQRAAYINEEIDYIKDLLEDYDDIKWIYEALLTYTVALRGLGQRGNEGAQVDDPHGWLAKVRQLDPVREGRWVDVGKQLDPDRH